MEKEKNKLDSIDVIVKKRIEEKIDDMEDVISVKVTDETWKKMRGKVKKETDEVTLEAGKIYEDIIEVLKYYCDVDEKYYPIISLWIIGTYLHKEFDTFPYLFFNAMRSSGKSRISRLIAILSHQGKKVMSMTEATIFRTPKHSTLCIDEFEQIGKKEQSVLRELLNASYKRGTTVERMKKVSGKDGEKYEVERYELFNPIVMCNIWGMEEVLQDRCITIILEKSTNMSIVKLIEDFEENPKIKEIKRRLEQIQCSLCSVVTDKKHKENWNSFIKSKYTTNYTTTYNTYNTITTLTTQKASRDQIQHSLFLKIDGADIDSRNLELFFPLLIIATTLDWVIFENLLELAKDISKQRKSDEFTESRDVMVYDFVGKLPSDYNLNYTPVIDLTKRFKEFTQEYVEDDKWITNKWLGRAFKRLNLATSKRRMARGVEVTLNINKAMEKIKMFK